MEYDLNSDVCDCPICQAYFTGPEADEVTDVEIDAELDAIVNELLGSSDEAPDDVDGLFEAIFDEEQPSDDDADYPYGPVSFNADEVRTIREALRFLGKTVCEKGLILTDPENEEMIASLPLDSQEFVSDLLTDGLVVSGKCKFLYDWFGRFEV